MRKGTLAVTFVLVYFVIWEVLRTIFGSYDFGITWWQRVILWGVVAFLVSVVLQFGLIKLNQRLLRWRKERGRDIEDEERYESDDGLISLKPRDKSQ